MATLRKLTLRAIPITLLGLCSFLLYAQDATQPGMNHTPSAGNSQAVSVTGCLKQGNETGGYYVTDQSGKTWELSGKNAELSKHVNHTVSVSGHSWTASKAQEAKNESSEKAEAGDHPYSDLKVAQVTMVSASCTQ